MKGQNSTEKQRQQLFMEKFALNHILNNRGSRDMLIGNLKEDWFTMREHKDIFHAIKQIKRKKKALMDMRDVKQILEYSHQDTAVPVALSIKDLRFIDNT